MSFVYLAAPYSSPDPAIREARVTKISKIAAILMEQGAVVYSPISHGHNIAPMLHPTTAHSHSFWMKQDLPLLALASRMFVYCEDGWSVSKGLQEEIGYASALGIPITYIPTGGESIRKIVEAAWAISTGMSISIKKLDSGVKEK